MPTTYREAIEELETILRTLETDAVDVDDLTARVERSAELIRLCRHKLRNAEASLERVFDTLDDEDLADEERPDEASEEEEPEDDDEDEEEEEDLEDDEDSREQAGGAGRPQQPGWLF